MQDLLTRNNFGIGCKELITLNILEFARLGGLTGKVERTGFQTVQDCDSLEQNGVSGN